MESSFTFDTAKISNDFGPTQQPDRLACRWGAGAALLITQPCDQDCDQLRGRLLTLVEPWLIPVPGWGTARYLRWSRVGHPTPQGGSKGASPLFALPRGGGGLLSRGCSQAIPVLCCCVGTPTEPAERWVWGRYIEYLRGLHARTVHLVCGVSSCANLSSISVALDKSGAPMVTSRRKSHGHFAPFLEAQRGTGLRLPTAHDCAL